jgi:hypothetical protein
MSTGSAIAVGWDEEPQNPSNSAKGYRGSETRGRDARTEARGYRESDTQSGDGG